MKQIKIGNKDYPFFMSMLHLEKFCVKRKITFAQLGDYLTENPIEGIYSFLVYGIELGARRMNDKNIKLTIDDIDEAVGMDMKELDKLTTFVGDFLSGGNDDSKKSKSKNE